MAKNKLKKFAENAEMRHVIEPNWADVNADKFELKGKWREEFFKNDNPIVVELGCGRGEYTFGLAMRNRDVNHIGMDIKGNRLWNGAKWAQDEGLTNIAFLRTRIELLDKTFAEGEIDEIWITFPDPQIKYKRMKHRMTNPEFLSMYRKVLSDRGVVHLKCDSEFLHGYTHGVVQMLGYPVEEAYHDIDFQLKEQDPEHILFTIQTYYEEMWREQGKPINYLRFRFQ
ncbi:tRNA (guanosine(46)-N7)-methyltransferase TrmB [Phaeocystidibacter luteus]|uniref:tRNA (guanine-N(7)-)-methyltransferase n=1 Tax=Phaeocystidibacter luteus TaxID=911197 RepID=A0A6N6RJ48_9FLAO|nr:tRNA (guanosine(46)-N7)-methyltransferase TrmB [Phaeocystidibacter luteus]KAB2813996.1 tRNA (guanosine(46)-N7)-methyltransferase TrmB [Phaeocystidibacter luteus]